MYSYLVFYEVMPREENWASTCANHKSGSDGQKGDSLRFKAATALVSRSTDICSRRWSPMSGYDIYYNDNTRRETQHTQSEHIIYYTVEPPITDPPRSGQPLYNGHARGTDCNYHRTNTLATSEKRTPPRSGQRTVIAYRAVPSPYILPPKADTETTPTRVVNNFRLYFYCMVLPS